MWSEQLCISCNTFPAPSLTPFSKNVVFILAEGSRMCGPRLTADWNGGERCAACRWAERFEWSSEASWAVQSETCPLLERPQWLSWGFVNIKEALRSGVNDIGVDQNGRSCTTGGRSWACCCRSFLVPCLICSLTTWRVNVWQIFTKFGVTGVLCKF